MDCVIMPTAYAQAILDYVRPWAADLKKVRCSPEIWHGDCDTWAPFAMAEALVKTLPCDTLLHRVSGGEHHATLTKTVLSFQTGDSPL